MAVKRQHANGCIGLDCRASRQPGPEAGGAARNLTAGVMGSAAGERSLAIGQGLGATVDLLWWSADASPVPSFAASELQRYLERITGVVLSVRNAQLALAGDGARSALALVPRGWKDDAVLPEQLARLEADLFSTSEPGDAFALRGSGNLLILAGASHRGTLYAAYELLRRLGVRFFAPTFPFYTTSAELVPRMPFVLLPRLDVVARPALSLRRKYVEEGWSHTPGTLVRLIDWMAKNRLNVLVYPYDYQGLGLVRWDTWRDRLMPELERRGLLLEVGGHGYQSFLPPPHYAAEHPGWFEAGDDGAWLANFDASSDEAQRAYVGNVLAYLAERPEIAIFDAWPADAVGWPRRAIDHFGGIPNTQAAITNRLADAAQEARLHTRIEALAYAVTGTLGAPDPSYAYRSSVIIDVATYDRSHAEPIFGGSPPNKQYARVIEQWRVAYPGNEVGIHEYYRRYAWRSLPVALPRLIGEDVAYYCSRGASGLGFYSEPADWLTYELNHLLAAALVWDSRLDVAAWLKSHLVERYGPAAGVVGQCMGLLEEAGRLLFDRPAGDFMSAAKVAGARERYARARSLLGRPAGVLLEGLVSSLDYALADLDISYFSVVEPDPSRRHAARETVARFLQQRRFDGIALPNLYSLRRCAETAVDRPATHWVYDLYRARWP
ncbi:MAG: DUF4838 domain-containing protein [Chloroflexota bacterium]|nr:DUF4838 domain-containing protein [Chloroflexota bacterium]